jgi:hypothetical protein
MATNNSINLHGTMPAFSVYLNTTQSAVTGDGTAAIVPFDTTIYATASSFIGEEFIAPMTGIYQFNGGVFLTGITSLCTNCLVYILVDGLNNYVIYNENPYDGIGDVFIPINCTLKLTAGMVIGILVTVTGALSKVVNIRGSNGVPSSKLTYFSGSLLALV